MDYDGNSLFSTSLLTPSSFPFAFFCFFYFQSFFSSIKPFFFLVFFFAVLTTPNYSILVSPPILLASIDAIGWVPVLISPPAICQLQKVDNNVKCLNWCTHQQWIRWKNLMINLKINEFCSLCPQIHVLTVFYKNKDT